MQTVGHGSGRGNHSFKQGVRKSCTGKVVFEQDLERHRHKGPRQEGRGGCEE